MKPSIVAAKSDARQVAGSSMSGSSMSGSSMSGSSMSGSSMSGAATSEVSGAALSGAALSGAALSGAWVSSAVVADVLAVSPVDASGDRPTPPEPGPVHAARRGMMKTRARIAGASGPPDPPAMRGS
ncbi:MAG: pentapeptide repeat-containing protein [Deltaproteobacteria bacterium]|nr:pentapeptide repeat-containing protein [Deltaproteobacteria bacterium]